MSLPEFEESMLKDDGKIRMVAFKAPWCAPCKMMTPTLEVVADHGHEVFVVDTDENEELTMKYGIRGVPTTIVFEGLDIKNTLVGAQSKGDLIEEFH